VKLKLVSVGKVKDPSLLELCQFYQGRLKPFVHLQVEEVHDCPVRKGMPHKIAADREAEEILQKIPDGNFYVALDERGKQKTTEEWAELFKKWQNESKKEITFVIGGAYGLSESILRGAREKLALSKLTFTHDMARVIFLEQVYRVYTLIRGVPYHH